MQPLKIIIPGEYWDSYIYKGRLYLFGIDGNIITLDWDKLISSWKIDGTLQLALECAFMRSDFLYGRSLQKLFHDPEIRELVKNKFERLSRTDLMITKDTLMKLSIGVQDNLCAFPHSDCEIYHQQLYVSAPSGVMQASAGRGTKYPISTRIEKKWDAPVFGLSASWGSLALAAGDEGLFELEVGTGRYTWISNTSEPKIISKNHCVRCNWMFHSIFGSSDSGGFLAAFQKESSSNDREYSRTFDRTVHSDELWDKTGYAWGVQDKFYLATKDKFYVSKYQPWKEKNEQRIFSLGIVEKKLDEGDVISASVATFGIVVEFDKALAVYPSTGESLLLNGEPVNWRVFPRAKHYENQLHVIWDDRLEILSFNQDYLVDQSSKILGISVMQEVSRPYWRNFFANVH